MLKDGRDYSFPCDRRLWIRHSSICKYGNLNVSLASHFVGKITAVLLSASVNEHEPMSGSLSQNVCLCSTDPSLSSRLRSFAFGFLR